MAKLALLFAVVPLVELYLLLLIGELLGFWPTVAVVLATALLGAWLAKREGLRVLRRWQEALRQARMPEEGVLGGVLLLVGGVLLVTPGVLTDALGLALLVPRSRAWIARWLRPWIEGRLRRGAAAGTVQVVGFGPESHGDHSGKRSPNHVIDVEGVEIDDDR